jgi:hypothetical protein
VTTAEFAGICGAGMIGAVSPGSERTLSFPAVLNARSPSLTQTPHGRAARPTKIRVPGFVLMVHSWQIGFTYS